MYGVHLNTSIQTTARNNLYEFQGVPKNGQDLITKRNRGRQNSQFMRFSHMYCPIVEIRETPWFLLLPTFCMILCINWGPHKRRKIACKYEKFGETEKLKVSEICTCTTSPKAFTHSKAISTVVHSTLHGGSPAHRSFEPLRILLEALLPLARLFCLAQGSAARVARLWPRQ